jgi:hypothetical protein
MLRRGERRQRKTSEWRTDPRRIGAKHGDRPNENNRLEKRRQSAGTRFTDHPDDADEG